MLNVDNLFLDYSGVRALQGVVLHVDRGEAVALVGSNGAGKTSLLNCIAGIHRPAGGVIRIGEVEATGLSPNRMSEFGVALVPEGRRLFGRMTVEENLRIGAYKFRRSAQGDVDRTLSHVFEMFPVLRERRKQEARNLSGGEQQMVAIGRALMSRPSLLMLDEPSLGIAPMMVERIFDQLREVHAAGTTILLVEQNVPLALDFADRGYVMQSGRVAASGSSEELLESDLVRKAYLGI